MHVCVCLFVCECVYVCSLVSGVQLSWDRLLRSQANVEYRVVQKPKRAEIGFKDTSENAAVVQICVTCQVWSSPADVPPLLPSAQWPPAMKRNLKRLFNLQKHRRLTAAVTSAGRCSAMVSHQAQVGLYVCVCA